MSEMLDHRWINAVRTRKEILDLIQDLYQIDEAVAKKLSDIGLSFTVKKHPDKPVIEQVELCNLGFISNLRDGTVREILGALQPNENLTLRSVV
jgi:hypothetical protein